MTPVPSTKKSVPQNSRRGFTLVELLVAVGLMVLLMTMFAQIFALAAGMIRDQKGLAENDQRARILTTVIRGDLERRTFREVMPFMARTDTNDQDLFPKGVLEKKKGYFAYSENDPDSDTDDVLRLTVSSTASVKPNADQSPMFGKSVILGSWNSSTNRFEDRPDFVDQPIGDDGVYESANRIAYPFDDAGLSTSAEVVYFLRGNNLYRRQLMLRDPYQNEDVTGANKQPKDDVGGNLISTPYPNYLNPLNPFSVPIVPEYIQTPPQPVSSFKENAIFWRDFDYSAYYDLRTTAAGVVPDDGPMFHGIDSLNNATASTSSLSIPKNRFGHSTTVTPDTFEDHPPREFISTAPGTTGAFIGAFTTRETSHSAFYYPGGQPCDPSTYPLPNDQLNPYDRYQPDMVLNAEGAVTAYGSEPYRVDEDLLMSNVHSFDIKIFDPLATNGADNQNGIAGIDVNGDGTLNDHAELGWTGTDDGAWRDLGWVTTGTEIGMFSRGALLANAATSTGYCAPLNPSAPLANQIPQYRFDTWSADVGMTNHPPFWSMRYLPEGTFVSGAANLSQILRFRTASAPVSPGELRFANFAPPTTSPKSYRMVYKAIQSATANTDAGDPPIESWPTVAGNTFQDGGVTWLAIDNWRPVRGIQITIRYVDPPTDQMREITITQSLVDP